MVRKIRSDATVGTVRGKYGIDVRNEDGRRSRSDKKVGTHRKGR